MNLKYHTRKKKLVTPRRRTGPPNQSIQVQRNLNLNNPTLRNSFFQTHPHKARQNTQKEIPIVSNPTDDGARAATHLDALDGRLVEALEVPVHPPPGRRPGLRRRRRPQHPRRRQQHPRGATARPRHALPQSPHRRGAAVLPQLSSVQLTSSAVSKEIATPLLFYSPPPLSPKSQERTSGGSPSRGEDRSANTGRMQGRRDLASREPAAGSGSVQCELGGKRAGRRLVGLQQHSLCASRHGFCRFRAFVLFH